MPDSSCINHVRYMPDQSYIEMSRLYFSISYKMHARNNLVLRAEDKTCVELCKNFSFLLICCKIHS